MKTKKAGVIGDEMVPTAHPQERLNLCAAGLGTAKVLMENCWCNCLQTKGRIKSSIPIYGLTFHPEGFPIYTFTHCCKEDFPQGPTIKRRRDRMPNAISRKCTDPTAVFPFIKWLRWKSQAFCTINLFQKDQLWEVILLCYR